jgi:hypothetical protein
MKPPRRSPKEVHLSPGSDLKNSKVEKLGFPHETLGQDVWDEVGADFEERRSPWHSALTGKVKIHFCKISIFVIFFKIPREK